MATITHQTDLLEQAKARLPEQFKNLTNSDALIAILIARYQGLEDEKYRLYTECWIDLAEGVQLDSLGELVGQPREGRTDAQYRLWIGARLSANRSNGRGDELLRILELVHGTLAGVQLIPTYPAAIRIVIDELPDLATAQSFWGILNAAKAAGVRLLLEYTTPPAVDIFTFAPADTAISDADLGWADDGSTFGGEWAGVVG